MLPVNGRPSHKTLIPNESVTNNVRHKIQFALLAPVNLALFTLPLAFTGIRALAKRAARASGKRKKWILVLLSLQWPLGHCCTLAEESHV